MKLLLDLTGRRLEIEYNKQKCNDILQNQEQGNMLKDMSFCHLRKNIKTIIGKRTRCFKNCFQKVVHKAGHFLGSKIADNVPK